MIARLLAVVSDLRTGGSGTFAALLEAQAQAAVAATAVILAALRGETLSDDATARLLELEHDGDRLRGQLIREMSERIATPIDREDLFRLSRSLDDILDNLRDFQREYVLFRPGNPALFVPPLEAASLAVQQLGVAVAALRRDPAEISRRTIASRKAGNQVRRLYDVALGELFETELSMETLKQRELLRRLDVVGLRLREAADALADAAVKRGAT